MLAVSLLLTNRNQFHMRKALLAAVIALLSKAILYGKVQTQT